jgi:TonB family protein
VRPDRSWALGILSDTRGVDFRPYLQGILQSVRENWYNLIPESQAMKKGKLAIEFAITKDGQVADMRLVASSGDVALDRPAWESINASSSFPITRRIYRPYLALRFRFYYNPDKGDLDDLKTVDLIDASNHARQNGHYDLAIQLFKRAMNPIPGGIAPGLLGWTYFDDAQDGLAINAFQKQIEVNPLDSGAFNDPGFVYLRERKYDEADKWFKKQIGVQPVDKFAHANLGISLLEQRRYEDAIPELEKAASTMPDNAMPQVNLGQAYLNLGQDEKAMAAFDKALTIAATPQVEQHCLSDIAEEVASRPGPAIRRIRYLSTAAALGKVSLDQLNRLDLRNVSGLANYWDTLGWVVCGEGKLDLAERYVSAAWHLGGSTSRGGRGESRLKNPLREICTVGSVRGENQLGHGGPTRARSWKRRTGPRNTCHPGGSLLLGSL